MKRKLLLAATFVASAFGMRAQTDVTSTYLTNADFSQTTALTVEKLYGYGKDGTPYGLQDVDGWTKVVLDGDNSNANYPNSAMAGGVLAYGSSTLLQGNGKAAPATDPDGNSGNCLGYFGVWGKGGYYYQEVTLVAGKYTINIPVYNQSGEQANTSYIGWIPNSGTSYTLATNPTVGSWTTLTATFTLTDATTGKICLGYQSKGSGSTANAMLYFDKVQILYTAVVVKDVLETALTAATNANAVLSNSDLTTAISTAQGVYDNEDATQDEVNSAAETLNAATELAMSAAGDVTGIFLSNPGFESSEASTAATAAGNTSTNYIDYTSTGWTNVQHSQWSSSAIVSYGGAGTVSGYSAPAADNNGNTGNTLGIGAGWGGCIYQSASAVTLPAGVYTLKVYGYNNGAKADFNSRNGFVPTSGTSQLSSKTSFTIGEWIEDAVTFTLNNATEGKFQIGGEWGNAGAGSCGKVFFDNITITYKSFLAGAKEAWDEAVDAANAAITANPNVTGEELTALNEELAKAEPTTVDGYNEATEDLEEATATLVAAATSYNALVAVNAMITSTGTLDYADAEKKPSDEVTATSASDATEKTASQYTALRAYYESHAMAEGVAAAVDYTSAVSAANAATNTGWTNGIGTNSGQGYTDADGNVASSYLDGGWSASAGANIDMTRSVEIPAGKYLLTVTARGANSLDTYTLSIGGETVNLPKNSNTGGVFNNGWDDVSLEFDADGTTQTLEVIANSTAYYQWISINRFRLVCLEINNDAYAGETEYAALNAAITAAEAKTLGFENGEYAPYNNVAALETLAAAKAIDQTAELTNLKTDVEAATTALENATWTANEDDVDAIYNGLFATVTEGANYPDGWTRTNGWGQMQSAIEGDYATAYYNQPGSLVYGSTGVYTMPLAENQAYKLTISYRSHENNSNNGVTISVLNAEDGMPATTFTGNGSTSTWKTIEAKFTTGAAGNYVLTLANSGNTWMTNVSLVKVASAAIAIDEAADYTPAETYADVTLTRTIKADVWNTFVVPFDLSNEELVAAFDETVAVAEYSETSADAENVTVSFTKMDTPAITANTPVLLKGAAGTSFGFSGKLIKTGEAKVAGNYIDFVGTYAATTDIAEGDYFIASDKLYKSAGSTTIAGTRAYLKVKTAGAKVRMIIDDEATGIEGIAADAVQNGKVYDLSGRLVKNPTKGLYIQNGKKYFVK